MYAMLLLALTSGYKLSRRLVLFFHFFLVPIGKRRIRLRYRNHSIWFQWNNAAKHWKFVSRQYWFPCAQFSHCNRKQFHSTISCSTMLICQKWEKYKMDRKTKRNETNFLLWKIVRLKTWMCVYWRICKVEIQLTILFLFFLVRYMFGSMVYKCTYYILHRHNCQIIYIKSDTRIQLSVSLYT